MGQGAGLDAGREEGWAKGQGWMLEGRRAGPMGQRGRAGCWKEGGLGQWAKGAVLEETRSIATHGLLDWMLRAGPVC